MSDNIEELRNEIKHLNDQILEKINSIQITDNSSHETFKILKEIIQSQRQEVSWKNEDISRLEQQIINISINNNSGTPENNLSDQSSSDDGAEKIVQLEKEIESLKNEKKEIEEKSKSLDEKNRMLKAALLMTVDTETKDVQAPAATLKEDKVIESKDETQDSSEKVVKIQMGPSTIKAPVIDPDSAERRRQCPNCGAAGAFILEINDKENVIYQDMGKTMYGKKYKCGDCRHEWK